MKNKQLLKNEKNEEKDDDDTVEYSMLTLDNIPWISQEVLNTIYHYK